MTKEINSDQAISGNNVYRNGYRTSIKQAFQRYPVLKNAKSVLTRSRGGGSSTEYLANTNSPKNDNKDGDDDDDDDGNREKTTSNHIGRSHIPNKKVLSLPFVAAASPSFTKSPLHLVVGITCLLYIMNQSHLLPKELSGVVSKVLFWPTLPITFMRRIGKWSTIVDDTVTIGGVPFFKFPERLYEDGVRGVINMCEEYAGPVKAYNRLGIEQLYLPTIDHLEPSFEDMIAAVNFIADFEAQGKGRVYVHCKAGHGRSAAIVYAWWLSKSPDITVVDMEGLNERLCGKRNVRKTLWKQPNINEFRSWLQLGREKNRK